MTKDTINVALCELLERQVEDRLRSGPALGLVERQDQSAGTWRRSSSCSGSLGTAGCSS